MTTRKNILNYLYSFFVSLFAVLAISGGIILMTIFNNSYFHNVLPRDYYDNVLKRVAVECYGVENEMIINITGTGVVTRRTSILSNAINWQILVDDVNGYINSSLNPESGEYRINVTKWKNIFLNSLTQYMSGKKMKLTDYQMSVFNEATERCVEIYKKYVEFPKLHEFVGVSKQYQNAAFVLTVLSIILTLVFILIILLQKAVTAYVFRYSMYASITVGFSLVLAPLIIYSTEVLSQKQFSEVQIVSDFWASYFNGVFGYLILVGIIILSVSVAAVIFFYPKLYKRSLHELS